MKKEKDPHKLEVLEIKQTAMKLSANSLYGYLGYKNSRFYAKTIAAMITLIGRNTLKNTVSLVEGKLKLDVIYGDTDSIMINTLQKDLNEALRIGNEVKRAVNSKYKLLEMEMDGVFKSILLLKKKKYACLKFENINTKDQKLVREM
jgi:DNA polymerase alpha subunit A